MKLNIFFSFILLSLAFYSTTTLAAHSPAAAPKAPAKPAPVKPAAPAAAPAKPLVPALPQSPSDTPGSSNYDIVKILRKAKSFNMLIRLLKTTQVINRINAQLITTKTGGLTILAPDDGAFSSLQVGFLNSLDDKQKIELLQFHVLPNYVSSTNFDSLSNPVMTMAGVESADAARVQLNVTAYGNNVNITTGVVNATLTGIVYMDSQLAIYHVDKVLLPLDFFKPKRAAPAPVALAKAPKADKDNSSAEDTGDDEASKDSSGAKSLIRSEGTMLVSLGVALAAIVIMSS